MRKFNLNWGVMLAIVVLLAFTYISFLGMLYRVDGVIWKAVLIAFSMIVIVGACVYFMVNAKKTKNKMSGVVGQVFFGGIILATFLMGGIPFANFLTVIQSKEKLDKEIEEVRVKAWNLDVAYNAYADRRIKEYQDRLSSAPAPANPDDEETTAPPTPSKKTSKPSKGVAPDSSPSMPMGAAPKAGASAGSGLKNFYASDIASVNDLKVRSLKVRLCPDSLSQIQKGRKDWLESISGMSVWNISLPANLNVIAACVSEWSNDYVKLSDVSYDADSPEKFVYNDFNTEGQGSNPLQSLLDELKHPGFSWHSVVAILLAIFASLVMMLPYWLAVPTPTKKASDNGIDYDKYI